MLKADEKKIIDDLLTTRNAFDLLGKEFIKREYVYFLLLDAALYANFGKAVPFQESDILSSPEKKQAYKKAEKRAFAKYMGFVYENDPTLIEMSNNIEKFMDDIDYINYPFLDAIRSYSEEEFKEIILSYFATYGNEIYKIVKKYFDEKRINMNSASLVGLLAGMNEHKAKRVIGYYLPILWLESGYIFSGFEDYDSYSASNVVHEAGHAIDAERFIFPQHKKIMMHGDVFLEIPSIPYEIGFYDYLKEQNIDKLGGTILRNNRAAAMTYAFERVRNILTTENVLFYENGFAGNPTDGEVKDFREDLRYSLAYIFAYHLSEIRKNSSAEFLKVLDNLTAMRNEMSLNDAIKMTGFSFEDFVTGKYIKGEIAKDNMELKRRYNSY